MAESVDGAGVHRPVGPHSGKEPVLGLVLVPVGTEPLQQLGRKHHLTRMPAFAFANVDDHPLAVDVGDFQIQGFLNAQASPVEQAQQGAVLEVLGDVEQCGDFFTAPDHG